MTDKISTEETEPDVWRVYCDYPDCDRSFTADDWYDRRTADNARRAAATLAGWRVRPPRGVGSRSRPDLCPEHSTPEAIEERLKLLLDSERPTTDEDETDTTEEQFDAAMAGGEPVQVIGTYASGSVKTIDYRTAIPPGITRETP